MSVGSPCSIHCILLELSLSSNIPGPGNAAGSGDSTLPVAPVAIVVDHVATGGVVNFYAVLCDMGNRDGGRRGIWWEGCEI